MENRLSGTKWKQGDQLGGYCISSEKKDSRSDQGRGKGSDEKWSDL